MWTRGPASIAVVFAAALPTFAQNTCDSGKLKCMRNKAGCLLKVHEKAIKTGLVPDAVKIGLCQSKFDDPGTGCVAKLEAKQDPAKPATVCSVVGNAAFLEASVDACVASALAGLGAPAGPSTCDSGKLKCMRTKAGCLLKVHEKAIKTGTAPDGARIALCQLKFDDPVKGCVAKLEAKQDAAKAATLCSVTGDTAALEAIVDACVADVVDDLTTCPADVENPEGLTATGAQFLHLDVADVPEVATAGDRFGATLVVGDFNGDGIDDLGVGMPGAADGYGGVATFRGAPSGLNGSGGAGAVKGRLGWPLGCPPLAWGSSLAAGDFLGTGEAYYVIGMWPTDCCPFDEFSFCSPFGDGGTGLRVPFVTAPGGSLPIGAMPGQTMTVGDFTGDGVDDVMLLASRVPNDVQDIAIARLTLSPDTFAWSLVYRSLLGDPVLRFPRTIARGDFDANPIDDIVVGYPTDGPAYGGEIDLILNPFTPEQRIETWNQDSPGMVGGSEGGDGFGASLAVGDFDGDGHDDLMVGVPGEDAAATNQGAFHRLLGDGDGLTATGNQLFGAITVQTNAYYGMALAAGRFDNADAAHELAVAAPSHDLATFTDSGYLDVRFGAATRSQWSQGTALYPALDNGVPGNLETNDRFGQALAVGDFNGDGADDLAIGVPDEDIGGAVDAGAVNVLYGTPSQCVP